MDNLLLRFPARLDVISPLHIGTGEKLSSKSFVRQGSVLVVADENRLLTWATADPRRASAFVHFAESQDGLGRFLNQHHALLSDIAAYQVGYEGDDYPRNVQVFIKDVKHQPYLPGSSLKGSLRSALLRGAMIHDPDLVRKANRTLEPMVRKKDKSASRALERLAFVPHEKADKSRQSNYDLIRVLSVSDSGSVESGRLAASKVRVLSVQHDGSLRFKTKRHGDKPMDIYAETLRPGTRLALTVTYNGALLQGIGPARQLDFATTDLLFDIGTYCRLAASNLIEQEIAFYTRHRQPDLVEWYEHRLSELEKMKGNTCLLPIGWGTGFDAKAVTDLLDEAVFESVVYKYKNTRGLGKPGGRGRWLGPDDSPKSRKIAVRPDGRLEPLGWVRLIF